MGMMPRIRNMLTESDAHEVVLFNLLVSMSSPTGSGGHWRARDDLRSLQHQQRWRPRCLGLSCNGLAGFLLRSHHCRRHHHFHPHYCHHCVSFILMNKTVTNSQRPSLGPGLSLPTLIATVETLARYFHRRPDLNDHHDQLSDDCVITIKIVITIMMIMMAMTTMVAKNLRLQNISRFHAASSVFVSKQKNLVSDFPHLKVLLSFFTMVSAFSLKPAPTVLLVLVLFLGIIPFNCSRLLFMTVRQQGLRQLRC